MAQLRPLLRFGFLLFVLSVALSSTSRAQSITLSGLVVEEGSQQPVEFATVKATDKDSKVLITGTTTDFDGRFKLEVPSANVELEITFIGFSPTKLSSFSESEKRQDLGSISLKLQGELLDDVIVTGKRSTTEFKLDRRVFNVGEDLSSTGASALELLNNVPSVTVDIEGVVALRGSAGVQILIDGKPSVLASEGGGALGTITADMIEKVEVITNPSAKYEAEGSAGIINIVLKKEEKNGTSGSISLNTGTPANHSFGASITQRSNKWNLFGQLGGGIRSRPRINRNINDNLIDGTSIVSDGDGERREKFVNIILGTDYRINDLNTLSLSGFFAYEWEENPSINTFREFDNSGSLTNAWQRTEDTEAGNPKWQYELNYTKQFDKDDKDHLLVASFLGNAFKKDQSSTFTTVTTEGAARFGDQNTATDFGEVVYTAKLDYTRPINEEVTLETGAQYINNDIGNDFTTSTRVGNEFIIDPNFSNDFEFDQGVLGVYATGSYEDEKWGVKAGLRYENTNVETFLRNTNERNPQNYANLFPSLAASYKLNEITSFQASYSKRIFRPRLWDLNPFFNIANNFNIRTGNPLLGPEFTDSYEVTGIVIFDKVSMNTSVYHRFTTDVVERITTKEGDVNISTPMNLGTTGATGVEFNAKYTPAKWLQLSTDLNYNYFNRKATFNGENLDFNADQITGRLVAKVELPEDIDLEISGNGESAIRTIQGRRQGFSFADIGIRKKVMNGRVIVSAGIRDVFASRRFRREVSEPTFFNFTESFRGRFYTLGVSYGFGKGEAMEFTGGRRR